MAITRDNASENLFDSDKSERLSDEYSRVFDNHSAFGSKLRKSRRSELALLLSVHSPRVVYIWREMEGSSEFISMMNQLTIIPIWKITPDDCSKN